jgi:hypothetical protein
MLFRTSNGKLVEINKYDYKNDRLYYLAIMELKRMFSKQR